MLRGAVLRKYKHLFFFREACPEKSLTIRLQTQHYSKKVNGVSPQGIPSIKSLQSSHLTTTEEE